MRINPMNPSRLSVLSRTYVWQDIVRGNCPLFAHCMIVCQSRGEKSYLSLSVTNDKTGLSGSQSGFRSCPVDAFHFSPKPLHFHKFLFVFSSWHLQSYIISDFLGRMPTIKLIYFDGRGRGESIRYCVWRSRTMIIRFLDHSISWGPEKYSIYVWLSTMHSFFPYFLRTVGLTSGSHLEESDKCKIALRGYTLSVFYLVWNIPSYRQLLKLAQVPFEDCRITFEEWIALKRSTISIDLCLFIVHTLKMCIKRICREGEDK